VAVAAAAPYLPTVGPTPAVGLHVAISLLVVPLARALGLGPFAAFASGITFAVHPVHVEPVAAPAFAALVATALVAAAPTAAARLAPSRRGIAPAALAAGLALAAVWTGGAPGGPLELAAGAARGLGVLLFPRRLVPSFAGGGWPSDVDLYLWSLPFCLAGIWAVKAATLQLEPGGARVGVGRLVPAVGAVLIAVFAGRALVYARAWRSDLALAQEAVRVAPGSCPARARLGAALVALGEREAAAPQLAEAAALGAGTACGEAAAQALAGVR
jgi:hypothetical protein